MRKTALIVDDSKSARLVLKRTLESHLLAVDTAESAEEALEYLNDHRPDVIFMDHLMPGMDGFEAVTAIKKNPATATIPIMMYTSQEGEVYVGQARALGAVGVLPKQVEPVEVSKILKSLRVIGGAEDDGGSDARAPQAAATSGEYPALESLDQDLRILIKDLFDQQRAILRRDLLDSYETIAARVVDEIRPPPPDESETEPSDEETRPSRFLQASVAVLAVVTMVFAALFWQREQAWQQLRLRQAELQQALENQRAVDAEDSLAFSQRIDEVETSLESLYGSSIAAIEWGANQAAPYPFGELPLGDRRLEILEQVVNQLTAIDFSGVVRIETHIANFCLSAAGTDGFRPAEREAPAELCDQVGMSPGEAYERGLMQSVAFANFVRLADERSGGRIRYEIVSRGNAAPLMDYPAALEGITAGDWNEIAAVNHRVEIRIIPD